VRIGLIMALAAAIPSSCSAVQIDASASANVPPGFDFVATGAGLFPPGQRRQAEDALRSMAVRTNVYGVVVAADEIEDPAVVTDAILSGIAALDGEGLVAVCTPDACNLTVATAFSPGLADAIEQVASAPDAARGQGLAPARRDDLRRWRELVGAVSTIDR
jgi:hypothetical protein